MRFVLLVPGLLSLWPVGAKAQTDRPLVTDRPSFSESPAVVDPGRVQIEAGYTFTQEQEVRLHSLGEVLVRIGVAKRLELRLVLNSYRISDGPESDATGFEDLGLAAKLQLADGSSDFDLMRPAIALRVGAAIPTGSNPFGEPGVRPEAMLSVGWPVSAAFSVGANLGAASASLDDDRFAIYSGSLIMGVGLAERLGVYAEAFGLASSEERYSDAAFLNGGLTLLLNYNLQLDARVGVSLTDPSPSYFLGLGFGWRI